MISLWHLWHLWQGNIATPPLARIVLNIFDFPFERLLVVARRGLDLGVPAPPGTHRGARQSGACQSLQSRMMSSSALPSGRTQPLPQLVFAVSFRAAPYSLSQSASLLTRQPFMARPRIFDPVQKSARSAFYLHKLSGPARRYLLH